MNGGAVKRTSDGLWAHIICALLLPGITFKDAVNKDPINVLTMKQGLTKQQCGCCGQKSGACLRCDQCNALFHPSCGLVRGATFVIPPYNSDQLKVMMQIKIRSFLLKKFRLIMKYNAYYNNN